MSCRECLRPVVARGLCVSHYGKAHHSGALPPFDIRTCPCGSSFSGPAHKVYHSRGCMQRHWDRLPVQVAKRRQYQRDRTASGRQREYTRAYRQTLNGLRLNVAGSPLSGSQLPPELRPIARLIKETRAEIRRRNAA